MFLRLTTEKERKNEIKIEQKDIPFLPKLSVRSKKRKICDLYCVTTLNVRKRVQELFGIGTSEINLFIEWFCRFSISYLLLS